MYVCMYVVESGDDTITSYNKSVLIVMMMKCENVTGVQMYSHEQRASLSPPPPPPISCSRSDCGDLLIFILTYYDCRELELTLLPDYNDTQIREGIQTLANFTRGHH